MKIAFVPDACIPFHGETLRQRPLGGTETAVIRLAEALDRMGGHDVFVFSNASDIPLTKPLYLPLSAIGDLGSIDVLVSVRGLLPLFAGIKNRHSFFWTGDSYDQLQHLGLGDKRIVQRLTGLWAVSNWHADTLCAVSGYPRNSAWIVRNGYCAELFAGEECRKRKRLIYASTPYRGLAVLGRLFPRIRAVHADAELHIFSGMEVYASPGEANRESQGRYQALFKELSVIDGCTLHGNVTQDVLAREFMRSSLLAYPNTFEETSCITAIEALAAGCPIVTTRKGALPETVGDAGVFLEGSPEAPAYGEAFVTAVNNLLADDRAWNELSDRALSRAARMTWDMVARDLTERLRELAP